MSFLGCLVSAFRGSVFSYLLRSFYQHKIWVQRLASALCRNIPRYCALGEWLRCRMRLLALQSKRLGDWLLSPAKRPRRLGAESVWGFSDLWLAGNERIEKEMETTIIMVFLGLLYGSTPSFLANQR